MLSPPADLPSLPPVQQRLFTGHLFPEEASRNLRAFAQRHQLTSNVWVPRRAFEIVLRPLGVFILPYAILCDTTSSGTEEEGRPRRARESGARAARGLVNADHTSNPKLFEDFRALLVPPAMTACSLTGSYGGGGGTRATTPAGLACVEATLWPLGRAPLPLGACHVPTGHSPAALVTATHTATKATATAALSGFAVNTMLPPVPTLPVAQGFDAPIDTDGVPILDPTTVALLSEHKRARGWSSNYWYRRGGAARATAVAGLYSNAQETAWPGRCNPAVCTGYVPVSFTGLAFPKLLTLAMQQRASTYGYVSRVWVTLHEAKELCGTRLRSARAGDQPPLYSAADTVGAPVELFCADQFEDSTHLFLTPREIALATRGVWLPPERLRGYPLLHRLNAEIQVNNQAGAKAKGSSDADAVAPDTYATVAVATMNDGWAGGRAGADTAMHDATRHMRLREARAQLANVRLFGFRQRFEEQRLLAGGLLERLREQAILRGFPTPHFVSHRHVHQYGLRVRSGQTGVTWTQHPSRLWDNAWTDGEVWFNVAQLAEPEVGLQLFYQHPRDFLSRRRLTRSVCVQCARVQARMRYRSEEWVPAQVLRDASWRVRPGAPMVPCPIELMDGNYRPSSGRHGCSGLYHLEEVELSPAAAQWLRSYRPVDDKGRPYLRTVRVVLVLRAHERGYESPVWVPIFPSSAYFRRETKRSEGSSSAATLSETDLSRAGDHFTTAPLVSFRGVLYANAQDVANFNPRSVVAPTPLGMMDPYVRAREERGEGPSAETLQTEDLQRGWQRSAPLRQADGDSRGGAMDPTGRGSYSLDAFDVLADDCQQAFFSGGGVVR